MEVQMVTAAGDRDVRALGIEPKRMAEVLGLAGGYVPEPVAAAGLA
jgi:hypothetical protein